ncbi:hypothetical protein [Streptomyces sp. NPDC051572]|uniref:hypothetical protein n=1 Tax=Streptomyces sp. NPDC051572 TaxID=3155802 RepID=UPI0034508582
MTDSAASYDGARVRFAAGQAHLRPTRVVPDGMVMGRFSVLSPGTERRQMAATVSGPGRDAGYMALAELDTGWILAPTPHGAALAPSVPGALTVPEGAAMSVVALARFQLMAALGLDRVSSSAGTDTVVVGSGPVALGCVLELHRRGAERIRVLTRRRHTPIGRAPYVATVTNVEPASADLVIDAAGRPDHAAELVAPGGTLGILGTPDETSTLSALAAHRGGWTVVGMHELAATTDDVYQNTYAGVAAWLADHLDVQLAELWCRRVPGHLAPRIFELLGTAARPVEPVVLFDWSAT